VKNNPRIIASLTGGALLIVLGAATLFLVFRQIEQTAAARQHYRIVTIKADNLLGALVDAETGQRGFVITGDETFLEPYLNVRERVSGQMEELSQLAQLDEAGQHLNTVRTLMDAKMTELAQVIQLRRNGDMTVVAARVASGEGQRLMDSFRTEIRDFIRIENLALARVDARLQLSLRRMFYGIVAVSVCALLVGILIANLYYRNNEHRLKNLVLVETQDLLNAQAKTAAQLAAVVSENEEQFRTLANSIPQLAWQARGDGFITWYNRRWYEYTGKTPEQMEGWGWQSVHDPVALPQVMVSWQAAITAGTMFQMEFPLRKADGTFRSFLTRVEPQKNADGQVVQWFGTNTDVTELKQAEENVRRLNAELEQRVIERTAELKTANTELEAFSYSVSHDLRTPVRAIDGYTQAVLEDYGPQLPAEGLRFLQTIRNSARHLGALIDDLLAFAQLKQLELSKHAVNTNILVRTTLDELGAPWANRQIELRVGDLPASSGDPALLKQVWLNLLSNALKYTNKRDQAEIEIGSRKANGVDVFFIRDNGIGFDMCYADKLFKVFQRFHRAEDYEGTGVGLAIVQRIVHRHGGRIWAEAALDRGATFSFTLEKETKT
jgi:PAS domain S-box-containing protein